VMFGATTIPVAVFDGDEVMAVIERERVTHMPGAPTMFWAILDHPRRADYDLSSLRVAMVAAASVPEELVHRMREELRLDTAMGGYGLTENHALVALTLPDDPPDVVATTVGRVVAGLELRVVDDEGEEVPTGQRGELLVRGFAHMNGYYDDPEATAAVIVDGWLHTGDIVILDERGYLHIVDRKKDMVIVGGFNVAPAEVEKALIGFEKIGQVAVIGIPDHHFGEVVAAFVIPKLGEAITAEDVIDYAREHVANYKVPRRVEIVDALPLNATGKVLKGELRKRLSG
jgi:acyl-CoA synthetase (AMP-forming)/AMP-acid ligase II